MSSWSSEAATRDERGNAALSLETDRGSAHVLRNRRTRASTILAVGVAQIEEHPTE